MLLQENDDSEMSTGSAVPARQRVAGRKRKAVASDREDSKEDQEGCKGRAKDPRSARDSVSNPEFQA